MFDTALLIINIIIGVTNSYLLYWIKNKIEEDKEI